MRRVGIAGFSGAGKTTLIERLLPALRARGLRVSVIKHAHHGFDIDRPGKDSWRHREAGAHEVLLAGDRRWVLMHEVRDSPPEAPVPLDALVARLEPVDLVLVEGFRGAAHPKLEVHRPSLGHRLLACDDPWVRAVATDAPSLPVAVPRFALDAIEAIADHLMHAEEFAR